MANLKPGPGKAPADGGEIAYMVAGEGPAIATTHPYATAKAGHPGLPGFTIITVWPRGFGPSSDARDNADYGFWRLADDLDAVRRHLGLDKWSFWGVSMGGFTGIIYALKYQDTLSAVVLDCAAPSHHYKDDPNSLYPTARASKEFTDLLNEPSWDTLRGYFVLRSKLEGYPNPEELWEQRLVISDLNPHAYAEILRRLEEFDTRSQLGEIRIPTLILAGEKDLQCPPSQAQIIADGIPGSILKVYADTGHGVIRNNPPGALDAFTEFVNSALKEIAAPS